MSHRWLKNKNPVKVARDKAARDERARVRSLRGSNSSTPPKRSSLLEPKIKQLEDSPVQRVEQAESSETSIQNISYRLQIEIEERAFKLSNWNTKLAILSELIGLSPNQTLPIDEARPSHLNLLQPIIDASSEPIVSNSPSQGSKTSSSSEYYLPHIYCEGICTSSLNTPRVSLTNRSSGEKEKDIVLYKNPISLEDVDEYYSTNGEPIVEFKTLAKPVVKGFWNCFHQPFPAYWNSELSSESNKDSGNSSNLLGDKSDLQRELT